MAPQSTYTLVSTMKDEGHCVLEWLAYHRLIGFDNICVYTNDCTDGTDRMLIRLQDMGVCHHFDNELKPGQRPQPKMLKKATANVQVMDSEWICNIDADEFVEIKTGGGTVPDLIAALPDGADGICMTWRFYGSNDLKDWSRGLVVEEYTAAAPDDFKKGWGVKSMTRPYPGIRLGIHRPHMTDQRYDPARIKLLLDQKWVNSDGDWVEDDFKLSGWRMNQHTVGYDLAEVAHFAVKSHEAYLLRRVRGNVNNKKNKYNDRYFAVFDRNETQRRGLAAWGDRIRTQVADWMADPEIARLQEAAHAYHDAKIAELRAHPDYDAWRAELEEAGAVPYDEVDDIVLTQTMPKDFRQQADEMRDRGVPEDEIEAYLAEQQTAQGGGKRERMMAEMQAALEAGAKPGGTLHNLEFVPGAKMDAEKMMSDDRKAKAPPKGESALPEARRRPPDSARRDKVVVCTMKNEGPYLLEWIAHHLSIGFDHFVIYSNDCTDGTNLILNRLQQLGLATHHENPLSERRKDPQRSAYSRAKSEPRVAAAEWVMVIDADEFVNVQAGDGKITDLIDACPHADAISLVWQQIGSGGAVRFLAEPVTHRFHRCANLEDPENGLVTGFKTLFRRPAFDYFGVHRPRFHKHREITEGYVRWVNGSGRDMGDKFYESGWRFNQRTLGYDLGVVNHYAIKSKEDFLLKKARGTANSGNNEGRIDLDYWTKYDLNSLPAIPLKDTGMPGVLAELKADPILGALHDAAVENARRQIALHMEDEELRRFIEDPEAPPSSEPHRDVA